MVLGEVDVRISAFDFFPPGTFIFSLYLLLHSSSITNLAVLEFNVLDLMSFLFLIIFSLCILSCHYLFWLDLGHPSSPT